MNRRAYLCGVGGTATAATAALAGCATVSSLLEREAYVRDDKASMLPDEVGDDWPDQDLNAEHDLNDHFDRVWVTPDEDLIILMGVDIYESGDEAKTSFERVWAAAADPREYPLADEALIFDDGEFATCMFRESNALGEVSAIRQSGLDVVPDRSRASQYADLLYEYW